MILTITTMMPIAMMNDDDCFIFINIFRTIRMLKMCMMTDLYHNKQLHPQDRVVTLWLESCDELTKLG